MLVVPDSGGGDGFYAIVSEKIVKIITMYRVSAP
jgi:hypothetical protein